jgi:Domain of unknown function (DU1801)
MIVDPPIASPSVAAVFDAYPLAVRRRLLSIRRMIFDVAAATPGVGALHETLKWGQPSYVTLQSKSGSPIRIDRLKARAGCGVFFQCQTTLVDTFRDIYRGSLQFEGNRCIMLADEGPLPVQALRDCIGQALTYHARKKPR